MNFKTLALIGALALPAIPSAALADPSDDFGWVMIAEVNAGADLAAVDAMVADIMDAARGNTGTLTFNFARVGTTIYGYEMFDNQAAFFGHFARVEPLLPQLMALWTPTAFVPTHELPEQIAGIMQQLGALDPDMTAALVH